MFINHNTEYVAGSPSRYIYGKLGDTERSEHTFLALIPVLLATAAVIYGLLQLSGNFAAMAVLVIVWLAAVLFYGCREYIYSRSESVRARYRRLGVLLAKGDDLFDLINFPQVRRRVESDRQFKGRVDLLVLSFQSDAMNDSPKTLIDKLFYLVEHEVILSSSLAIIRDGLSENNAKEFERSVMKVLVSRLADEVQTVRVMSRFKRDADSGERTYELERLERYLAAAVHSSSN